jgi:transcriptional regulator with XRE-family HTH domain
VVGEYAARKDSDERHEAAMRVKGRELKRERLRKALTQKQVADLVGVVPETIRRMEAGRAWPSTLKAACRVYGVGPYQYIAEYHELLDEQESEREAHPDQQVV